MSTRILENAQAYLDHGGVDRDLITRYMGTPIYHPEELIDLYELASGLDRKRLFPLIDPAHYAVAYRMKPDENLLADYLSVPPDQRVHPHPLVDLRFMRHMRPDFAQDFRDHRDFAALIKLNLVAMGPYLRRPARRGGCAGLSGLLKLMTGEGDLSEVSELFDPDQYRMCAGFVPAGEHAALMHFVTRGDAAGYAPGPLFDPVAYRRTYATPDAPITHPTRHFLWHGQFNGFKARPKPQRPVAQTNAIFTPPAEYHALHARLMAVQRAPADISQLPPPGTSLGSRTTKLPADIDLILLDGDNAATSKTYAKDSAPYVLLASPDIVLSEKAAERLREALVAQPSVAMAVPMVIGVDGTHAATGLRLSPDGGMHPDVTPQTQAPMALMGCVLLRRSAVGPNLFGSGFRTAAFAGADLSLRLRQDGHRLAFFPEVRASLTTTPADGACGLPAALDGAHDIMQVLDRWRGQIAADSKIRVFARLGVLWSGGGSGLPGWDTLWRGASLHADHQPPGRPGELGFYDDRVPDVLTAQMALAQDHGISGFVLDHYRFAERSFHDHVFRNILAVQSAPSAFALGWRVADSARMAGYAGQRARFDAQTVAGVAQDIRALATSGRAITVDGRPLFVVHDAQFLPDGAVVGALRRRLADSGIHPHILVAQDSEGDVPEWASGDLVDGVLEHPLACWAITPQRRVQGTEQGVPGDVRDFSGLALARATQRDLAQDMVRCIPVGHDDSALGQSPSRILYGATPDAFQATLDAALRDVDARCTGDKRMLVIDAWNDWARGAYLEPDGRHGRARLVAVRNALNSFTSPHAVPQADAPVLAVHLHAYYPEVAADVVEAVAALDMPVHLFVSTPQDRADQVHAHLRRCGLPHTLHVMRNHGRDILPFLSLVPEIHAQGHDVVLKLHSKKSPHRGDGANWAADLLAALTDRAKLTDALHILRDDPSFGVVAPEGHVLPLDGFTGENRNHLLELLARSGLDPRSVRAEGTFVAGSMFLARISALLPLLNLGLTEQDFEDERGQVNGTMAHAVERMIGVSCAAAGMDVRIMGTARNNALKIAQFYQPEVE